MVSSWYRSSPSSIRPKASYQLPAANFQLETYNEQALTPRHGTAPEWDRLSVPPSAKCQKSCATAQLLCFQNFTCNSHALNILQSSSETEVLFSRFYGYPGEGVRQQVVASD